MGGHIFENEWEWTHFVFILWSFCGGSLVVGGEVECEPASTASKEGNNRVVTSNRWIHARVSSHADGHGYGPPLITLVLKE